MKKLLLTLLLALQIFTLTACLADSKTPIEPITYLDIYYVNDFHGAILPDGNRLGMAYIGNFLIAKKHANPENTIILAGGDMLQGSALSNYVYGETVIELMNETYFDAFVVGNHEFDWGLEKITRYFDGLTDQSIANFPFLGANIHHNPTNNLPVGVDPYTIIERGDLKIGIIGTIGYGLERSIATQHSEDYAFLEPASMVREYARYLRTEEAVDIVILLTHDSGGVNDGVTSLTGDEKIDAIFNAHSHQVYTRVESGIPVMQSGGYGSHVGHMRLEIDEGVITAFTMANLTPSDEPLLTQPNLTIQTLINGYVEATELIFNESIIFSHHYFSRSNMTLWMSRLMRVATGADIGIQNYGGTRQSIQANQDITLSVLYNVYPFDNTIKTVWLSGAEIKAFISGWSDYDTDITYFHDDLMYKVATNDFIFDQPSNPFIYGQDIVETGLYQRDLAVYEMNKQSEFYDSFHIDNSILTNYIIPTNNNDYTTPSP